MRAGLAAAILGSILIVSVSSLTLASAQSGPAPQNTKPGVAGSNELGGMDGALQAFFGQLKLILQQVRTDLEKVRTTLGPSLMEQTGALAELAPEAQVAADLPAPVPQEAQAASAPLSPEDGSMAPACTTKHEPGDNWVRISIHCLQQVQKSGSFTKSVSVSSSISQSQSSSSQSR
jgi:hypothetical protein